mmetsp:Transcript_5350/g.6234  ORF Transcript_5350/g.6234 Transcript_5350/m.6234 type:complete len:227 (+) Transcript_5350:1245-1925(+)
MDCPSDMSLAFSSNDFPSSAPAPVLLAGTGAEQKLDTVSSIFMNINPKPPKSSSPKKEDEALLVYLASMFSLLCTFNESFDVFIFDACDEEIDLISSSYVMTVELLCDVFAIDPKGDDALGNNAELDFFTSDPDVLILDPVCNSIFGFSDSVSAVISALASSVMTDVDFLFQSTQLLFVVPSTSPLMSEDVISEFTVSTCDPSKTRSKGTWGGGGGGGGKAEAREV